MHESQLPTHTRRAFLAALAAAGAASLLAACGSTQPAVQAPAAAPTAAPAAPAATTAPAAPAATTAPAAAAATTAPAPTTAAGAPTPAAAAKAAKASLRFSHWWGEQFANYIPLMEQKTGIAVQEERSPYNGYFQKLLTQLVSGSAPDMFLVDANQNGAFFTSDALVPFDDYLKTAKVDLSKFNVDQGKENGYGGKTMGLSLFTMQDLIVHVNVELANKDGLLKDAPLWGKPNYDSWHWQDFVTWLKAGTHVKSDGTVDQYGLGNSFADWGDVQRVFVSQNGGAIFDDEWGYKETKATVDQPQFLEAVQFLADLTLKDKVASSPDAEKAIQGGTYRAKRALATITWSTPSIYPPDIFEQEHFHLPFSKNKVHAFGANYISVNKASQQTDAAFQWVVQFCVDQDVRTKFLQISSVPSYDPLPIVQASPEGPPKTIALINLSRIQGMSTLPADAQGVVSYPRWYGVKAPQFTQDTLAAAMQSVVIGKATAKDAFTQAKTKIDAELAKK